LPLGKSAAKLTPSERMLMSRVVVLVVVLLLLIGGLVYLSRAPKEQPTRTIEVDVAQPSANGGNAH
jgi:hypothetical protein